MQKKLDVSDRDFFKKSFSRSEIEKLLKDRSASDMFNVRSPSFKKLGIKQEKLSQQEMIDLMVGEPRLIRRPVVQIGAKVYFGANSKMLTEIFGLQATGD